MSAQRLTKGEIHRAVLDWMLEDNRFQQMERVPLLAYLKVSGRESSVLVVRKRPRWHPYDMEITPIIEGEPVTVRFRTGDLAELIGKLVTLA